MSADLGAVIRAPWARRHGGRVAHADYPTPCWIWTGALGQEGYGLHLPHRRFYEDRVGPIPEGKVIDHLCRNRACVNPAHMEPVTIAENVMRGIGLAPKNAAKVACPHGHPYDDENTYLRADRKGRISRHCRACNRARAARNYERRRAAA